MQRTGYTERGDQGKAYSHTVYLLPGAESLDRQDRLKPPALVFTMFTI